MRRLAVILLAFGCNSGETNVEVAVDSSDVPRDAAVTEAGGPDVRSPDARRADFAPVDARPVDAHQPDAQTPDARQPDVRQPDARQPDARQPDARQPDARQPDARQPDARQPDARQSDAQAPDARPVDAQAPDAQAPDAAVGDPFHPDLGVLGDAGLLPLPDGGRLEIDPAQRDPVTAYGFCAQLVLDCSRARGEDPDCVRGVRRCATDEPWNEDEPCCPAACVDAYDQLRDAGVGHVEAMLHVFAEDRSCFPGLRGAP